MSPVPDSLLVNAVERKGLLRPSSLRITDELNGRNECQFDLVQKTASVVLQIGEVVEVKLSATTIFKGTIESLDEVRSAGTVNHRYAVKCVDFNQLADRHLVAEIYESLTMKQIVDDIRTDHLAVEGVTLDPSFPDGPTLERIPFDHVSVAEAFDELSEISGFFWNIGYDKVLRFIDRTTMVAPKNIDSTVGGYLADTLTVNRTRSRYRNSQFLRGGLTVTETSLTETFAGDGETKSFPLSLQVDSIVSIKVNAVAKTVGIRGVDTGKDWYYQVEDNIISQDNGGTALAGGSPADVLEVIYFGQFPLRVAATDTDKVAERAAIEGGSGLYEMIEDFEDIDRLSLGRERALGLIARFGDIEQIVELRDRTSGWQAGQLLTVSIPEHNISGNFMVASVEFEERELQEFWYSLRLVQGAAVEGWVEFFKKLARDGRRKAIRPNEILHLIRAFSERALADETFSASSVAFVCAQVDVDEVDQGEVCV